jgi:hypothetical protein
VTGHRDYWVIPGPAAFGRFFPTNLRSVYRPPSPRRLRVEVHPPTSFTSPSEHDGSRPAPALHRRDLTTRADGRRKRLPWGSAPHRDVNRRRPRSAQASRAHAAFRPRRFSRPRRFAPPPALRVCFTPLPRPGFALQGVVPRRGAVPGFPDRLPSCRWTQNACGLTRAGFPRPRLQGLAPRDRCGDHDDGLGRRDSAPLMGLCLLRALAPRTLAAPSRHLRPRPSPG